MATLVSIKILCISIVYKFTNRYRSRNKSMLFLRSWFKRAILEWLCIAKAETKRTPVYIPTFFIFLVFPCKKPLFPHRITPGPSAYEKIQLCDSQSDWPTKAHLLVLELDLLSVPQKVSFPHVEVCDSHPPAGVQSNFLAIKRHNGIQIRTVSKESTA
jgi:hypothetical protein